VYQPVKNKVLEATAKKIKLTADRFTAF